MIKLSGFINMTPPSQMKEGMYDENDSVNKVENLNKYYNNLI